jgi:hypothetical protein
MHLGGKNIVFMKPGKVTHNPWLLWYQENSKSFEHQDELEEGVEWFSLIIGIKTKNQCLYLRKTKEDVPEAYSIRDRQFFIFPSDHYHKTKIIKTKRIIFAAQFKYI